QGIEVITHSAFGEMVYVFRGRVAPKTADEAQGLATRANEFAFSPLSPIGSNNTDAGRELYHHGDQHAVLTGNSDGEVTACVLSADGIVCQSFSVKTGNAIEYPDGRFAAGVTPVAL